MPRTGTEDEYARWLADVNELIAARFDGITLDDLPDIMTRAAFDAGTTPEEFFSGEVRDMLIEEFGDQAVLVLLPDDGT